MRIIRATAAGVSEIKKFVPRLLAIVRELFHEVVGFVFIALALFFTVGRAGLIHAIQNVKEDPESFPRLLLVGLFVAMFAGFGVSSFLRARRISKGG
jgi:fumarate reductase subunit D